MKNIILSILLILTLASVLYSQVEIKQNEFPKGTLNETDLWKFTSKNTGKDNLEVVYTLSITYNDTLLYESSTKSYMINAGESENMDLKFDEPPLKHFLSNNWKRMIIREGDFFPGDYKICM